MSDVIAAGHSASFSRAVSYRYYTLFAYYCIRRIALLYAYAVVNVEDMSDQQIYSNTKTKY